MTKYRNTNLKRISSAVNNKCLPYAIGNGIVGDASQTFITGEVRINGIQMMEGVLHCTIQIQFPLFSPAVPQNKLPIRIPKRFPAPSQMVSGSCAMGYEIIGTNPRVCDTEGWATSAQTCKAIGKLSIRLLFIKLLKYYYYTIGKLSIRLLFIKLLKYCYYTIGKLSIRLLFIKLLKYCDYTIGKLSIRLLIS